jgi:hypothetical protein
VPCAHNVNPKHVGREGMGCTCQDLAGQRLELERQLCSRARA